MTRGPREWGLSIGAMSSMRHRRGFDDPTVARRASAVANHPTSRARSAGRLIGREIPPAEQAAAVAEAIAALVAAAPPLSPAQRDVIAAELRSGGPS